MELDFAKISVREVLNITAHPMVPGHYALRHKKRYSDCFLCVLGGSALYTFENYTFRVSKGDIFYLAYQSQYDIDVDEGYDVIYSDCMLDAPKGVFYDSQRFEVESSEDIVRTLFRVERKWMPQVDSSRLQLMSALYCLFATLAQQRAMGYLSSDNRLKMGQAREAIEQGASEKDFSCAALGKRLGLSEVHFRRLFSQMYGMTPNQFLSAMRIRTAKSLLLRGDLLISEIAERSGYHSVYYFCRAFKRETDLTPSEYRKMIF